MTTVQNPTDLHCTRFYRRDTKRRVKYTQMVHDRAFLRLEAVAAEGIPQRILQRG